MTSETPRKTALWRWLASLAVGAFCLWLLFRDLDLQEVRVALQQARRGWLALAVLCVVGVAVIKGLRWWFLYPLDRRPSSWRHTFSALMTSQMLNVSLPIRLGEVARVGLMLQQKIAPGTTLSTIVGEKSLDLLSVGFLILVAAPAAALPSWFPSSGGAAMGVVGAALLGLLNLVWLLRAHIMRLVEGILRFRGWLSARWQDRLTRAAGATLDGVSTLTRYTTALPVIGLTVVSWIVSILTMVAMLAAFGLPARWHVGLVLSLAISLSNLVPTPPALLGVVGAVSVMVLSWFGVARPEAAALGLVLNLVLVGPLMVLGGWSTWIRFSSFTRGALRERWAWSLGLKKDAQ